MNKNSSSKRKQIPTPPPIETIPLPGAKEAEKPIAVIQTAQSPQVRKFAATTISPAEMNRRMAGYPSRMSRKTSFLMKVTIAVLLCTIGAMSLYIFSIVK